MNLIELFERPHVNWGDAKKPVVIADGHVFGFKDLPNEIKAEKAYVVGTNAKTLGPVCNALDTKTAIFYEMRADDLEPIHRISGLENLAITWNSKVSDLEWLQPLKNLKNLKLDDVPKIADLSAIADLSELQRLHLSGNLGSLSPKMKVESLQPLARLSNLSELTLLNIRVRDFGLKPISACKKLETLNAANVFDTEDFAYLSVHLSKTKCDLFSPYRLAKMPLSNDGKTGQRAMVTGRRKPFLDPVLEKEKLEKYVRKFAALQEQFRQELI